MIPTLSICIPTLNRPKWLLQSLNSIFCEPTLLGQIELCISNNCSESDYAAVEQLLDEHVGNCSINYVRQAERLPLDENHHFVKRLAKAEYIYFLGDDDFFLRDELRALLGLINREKPDLAIFNGYLVDEANAYLGRHFALVPREYVSLETAFRDLWDKGSFGAVLVRSEMLQDADFEHLYRTDHAYGCYWLSLFRKHERGEIPRIMVPDFPCVAMRCAIKMYNHIDVYFRAIPSYQLAVRQRMVSSGRLRQLCVEQEAAFDKSTASLRFLSHLGNSGHDLRTIHTVNPTFYVKYRYRIWFARHLAASAAYKGLRCFYRGAAKKLASLGPPGRQGNLEYKLSSAFGRGPCLSYTTHFAKVRTTVTEEKQQDTSKISTIKLFFSKVGNRLSPYLRKINTKLNIKHEHRYRKFSILLPSEHLLPVYQKQHIKYDRFLPHLVKYIKKDASIIDVGANCADTLAGMVETNPNATYVCIEPDNIFYNYLQGNVERIRKALGTLSVYTINSLVGKNVNNVYLDGVGGTKRAVISANKKNYQSESLDSILSSLPDLSIGLIKTDVDGFDYDVLDSAEVLLANQSPIIFFEYQCDFDYQKTGYEKTITWLESLGYSDWTIFDNFGGLVIRTKHIQQIFQLMNYVWKQNKKETTRTIYYFDVLAAKDKDVVLVDDVLSDYY